MGNFDNPNPYSGLSGGSGKQSVKPGQRAGRRPLDMAPANLVHRTRNVGSVIFTGQPSDGDTVTLTYADGTGRVVVFEFESGGGVAAGNVSVTIGGSTSDTADNLNTAFLANLIGSAGGFQPLRLTSGSNELANLIGAGRASVGASLTGSVTNATVDDLHGDVEHGSPAVSAQTRTPTTDELATGVMIFPFDFALKGHLLAIRDASNVLKAFDGSSSSDSLFATVLVDNGAGSVPFAAGDTVSVLGWSGNVSWEDTVVFD